MWPSVESEGARLRDPIGAHARALVQITVRQSARDVLPRFLSGISYCLSRKIFCE